MIQTSRVLLLIVLACTLSAQKLQPEQSALRLNVDIELVEASATVLDRKGRFVTGLEKENFKIFEDKVLQQVVSFSSEDVPVSVGIILDVSGSMKEKLKTAVKAAITFMKGGNSDDEYALLEFADRPVDIADFTRDITRIQSPMMLSRAKGETALYDAVYKGLNKLDEANNHRRALLLITDGQDNRSRYTYSHVKEFVKEKDVQIYAIGLSDGWVDYEAEQGRAILRKLTALTGGNSFFPPSVSELQKICRLIAQELKNQYVIGYHSTNTAKDGKWRQIKVSAEYRKDKLTVRARPGYYAPARAGTDR
jgi:Ca-activated chloride channel family protein